jgi:hypothetical protein
LECFVYQFPTILTIANRFADVMDKSELDFEKNTSASNSGLDSSIHPKWTKTDRTTKKENDSTHKERRSNVFGSLAKNR